MITFTVATPLEVPLDKDCEIPPGLASDIWLGRGEIRKSCGCYIFAVPRKRGVAGWMPIYVGKTERSFEVECFATGNLYKLGKYLRHYPPTKLLLFLVIHPVTKGVPNGRAIGELEERLIHRAYGENRNLINKQNAKVEGWTVRGVFSKGKGKPSQPALALREVLGMHMVELRRGYFEKEWEAGPDLDAAEPVDPNAVGKTVAPSTATSAPVLPETPDSIGWGLSNG